MCLFCEQRLNVTASFDYTYNLSNIVRITMDKKLTLLLDEKVIDLTKEYAKKQGRSLSSLVEEYFIKLSFKSGKNAKLKVSPKVKKLSGIVHLPQNTDIKKGYANYLSRKYNK